MTIILYRTYPCERNLDAKIFNSSSPMSLELVKIFPSIHDGKPHNHRRRKNPRGPVGGW